MKCEDKDTKLLLIDEIRSLEREIVRIRQSDPGTAHGRIMWKKLPMLQMELNRRREQLDRLEP